MVGTILGATRDSVELLSSFHRRRLDERAFTVSTTADVAAGGTVNLHLENPTDGTTIEIHNIHVTSRFAGRYDVFDTFDSAPSGGTSQSIDNMLMGSANGASDSGQMTAASDVSFSATNTHFQEIIPSGGTGGTTVGGEGTATRPLIEPGREIVTELSNNSAEQRPGGISYVYSELTPD